MIPDDTDVKDQYSMDKDFDLIEAYHPSLFAEKKIGECWSSSKGPGPNPRMGAKRIFIERKKKGYGENNNQPILQIIDVKFLTKSK